MTVCLSISLPLPTCLPVCLSVCHSTLHSIDSLSSSSLSFPFHQSSLLSACLSVMLYSTVSLALISTSSSLHPFLFTLLFTSFTISLSPYFPFFAFYLSLDVFTISSLSFSFSFLLPSLLLSIPCLPVFPLPFLP